MSENKKNPFLDSSEVTKYEAEIEKLTNRHDKLLASTIETDNVTSNFFQQGIKKAVKFGLAIFSIRTAYTLASRAANAYLSVNDDLSNKLQSVWIGLGSFLAPAIEYISDILLKAIGYLNVFIKALTGIDFIARSNAKALEKQAKAQKNLNNQQASFDEQNVLQDNSSSSQSPYSGTVDIPELDQGIVTKLQEMAEWLKENYKWLLLIGGTIGAVFFVGKIIDFLTTLSSIRKILDFISSNFTTIAGVISVIVGLFMYFDAFNEILTNNNLSMENMINLLGGIALVGAGVALLFGTIPALITILVMAVAALVAIIIKNWDTVKELLETGINVFIENVKSIFNLFVSFMSGILATLLNLLINPFVVFKNTALDVVEGVKTIFRGLIQVINSLFNGDLKGILIGFKTIFKGIMDSLWAIAKAPLNLIIGGINSLIKGLNKVSFDVPDWVPGIGGQKWGFNIKTIPKLAKGGIVNQPTQAIIGEAGKEAVLPLENNREWMYELADIISQNNGPQTINLVVDGKVLAKIVNDRNKRQQFATGR